MSSATATSTPSERRRSQQREEARRTILDATEALLVEDGYERFSMRRLAERCGYSAPTIYHHFGDKQGLIDAVVEARFRLVLDRIDGVPRDGDPGDTVRAILLEFGRFGLENPTHYRLLSLAGASGSDPGESAEKTRAALAEPVAELVEEGRLRTRDVDQAVQFLWVTLHGYVAARTDRPDAEWTAGLLEFTVDSALRGLRADVVSGPGRVTP